MDNITSILLLVVSILSLLGIVSVEFGLGVEMACLYLEISAVRRRTNESE